MYIKTTVFLFLLINLLFTNLVYGQSSTANGQQIWIPTKQMSFGGKVSEINLDATLYKPEGTGPFSVMIFNHGYTGFLKKSPQYESLSDFFVKKGIAVIFPARKGINKSGGSSNDPSTCDIYQNKAGINDAIEDIDAVVSYIRKNPFLDSQRLLIGGHSRGGFLSIIYTAKRPELGIKGVTNFSGIWNDDRCPEINDLSFAEAGFNSKTPTLWLYGENDRMTSNSSAKRYVDLYKQNGGNAIFHLYSHNFGNGHNLLVKGESLWSKDLFNFIDQITIENK